MDEKFTKVFFLADGIYPSYSRFVRGIKELATRKEKNYASRQEGAPLKMWRGPLVHRRTLGSSLTDPSYSMI